MIDGTSRRSVLPLPIFNLVKRMLAARTCIRPIVLLILVGAPLQAEAQLRYMGSFDVREQWNSDVTAGQQNEVGAPEPERRWDFITELSPSVRLYYLTPRTLSFLRYTFLLQVYALTQDQEAGRNLLGYSNTLSLGTGYAFNRSTQGAIQNRVTQGTENTAVGPYVSSGSAAGQVNAGYHTTGNSFFVDSLTLAVSHQVNERWSVNGSVIGDVFLAYDRYIDPDGQVIPPPWNFGVTTLFTVQRHFTSSSLGLDIGYSFLSQYYDQSIPSFEGAFPEQLDTMIASALLTWQHELSPRWDYRLGLGADLRFQQEYALVGTCQATRPRGCSMENIGYGDPGYGPAGEAGLRFRWHNWLAASLGYGHRTQRLIENRVGIAAETDTVGADFYAIVGDFRFDVLGTFRYMRITSQAEGQDNEAHTLMGRAGASVAYLIRPGVSVDLSYDMLATRDMPVYGWTGDTTTGGSPSVETQLVSYEQHLVTVGLSLAYPPPPPQDVRFNRRESEYEPLFPLGSGGGTEEEEAPASVESSGGEGRDPDAPDPDGLRRERDQPTTDPDGLPPSTEPQVQ